MIIKLLFRSKVETEDGITDNIRNNVMIVKLFEPVRKPDIDRDILGKAAIVNKLMSNYYSEIDNTQLKTKSCLHQVE